MNQLLLMPRRTVTLRAQYDREHQRYSRARDSGEIFERSQRLEVLADQYRVAYWEEQAIDQANFEQSEECKQKREQERQQERQRARLARERRLERDKERRKRLKLRRYRRSAKYKMHLAELREKRRQKKLTLESARAQAHALYVRVYGAEVTLGHLRAITRRLAQVALRQGVKGELGLSDVAE